MTIECYNTKCPKHSCHTLHDEGPFCDEKECVIATLENEEGFKHTEIFNAINITSGFLKGDVS